MFLTEGVPIIRRVSQTFFQNVPIFHTLRGYTKHLQGVPDFSEQFEKRAFVVKFLVTDWTAEAKKVSRAAHCERVYLDRLEMRRVTR